MESPHDPMAAAVPRRRGWGRFSLLSLLLLLALCCVIAAWWGERQRRIQAQQSSRLKDDELNRFYQQAGALAYQPGELSFADPDQVHVKALKPGIGARDEAGWAWRIYLPSWKQWWLEISQGEVWDESGQRYCDGVSSIQIPVSGQLTVSGCISYDNEGGRWIQNWVGGQSFAVRLTDKGIASLRAPGESTRTVRGEHQQETFPPDGQIELIRWHRTADSGSSIDAAAGGDAKPSQYGFSIYLVDETPKLPGAKTTPK